MEERKAKWRWWRYVGEVEVEEEEEEGGGELHFDGMRVLQKNVGSRCVEVYTEKM